jgi:hypothetical protein
VVLRILRCHVKGAGGGAHAATDAAFDVSVDVLGRQILFHGLDENPERARDCGDNEKRPEETRGHVKQMDDPSFHFRFS